MTDYIDRQEAIDAVYYATGDGDKADFCADVIRSVPSEDVAPVRHGRWDTEILTDACGCKHAYYACSVCGFSQNWDEFGYCPNCGARMDGGL